MVIISSAQKFNLVGFDKGIITISENYKLIKHAYTSSERLNFLKKSFLAPQVFTILYERFKGKALPVEMLDKILIREFEVEEITAGRVAGYFTEGLKTCGLLNGNIVIADTVNTELPAENLVHDIQPKQEILTEKENTEPALKQPDASFSTVKSATPKDYYEVQLSGPGIHTTLNLEIEEDVLILEAIIKKVRKNIIK